MVMNKVVQVDFEENTPREELIESVKKVRDVPMLVQMSPVKGATEEKMSLSVTFMLARNNEDITSSELTKIPHVTNVSHRLTY